MARFVSHDTSPDMTSAILALRSDIAYLQVQVSALKLMRLLTKHNFDPGQPRVPAGSPDGGQWTDAGGGYMRVALNNRGPGRVEGGAEIPPLAMTESEGASVGRAATLDDVAKSPPYNLTDQDLKAIRKAATEQIEIQDKSVEAAALLLEKVLGVHLPSGAADMLGSVLELSKEARIERLYEEMLTRLLNQMGLETVPKEGQSLGGRVFPPFSFP